MLALLAALWAYAPVLRDPIVKEDTYCLEVVGKELRGEGERNAQGEREGRGTMVYASGDMYEGQWRAGVPHGQGKYSFATGDVYEGGWVEGEMHGQGKYSASIGDVYEGEHVAGEYHGRGKMTFADGNSYEGEWAEDKQHGKGTYTLRQRRGGCRPLRGGTPRWGRASSGVRTGRRRGSCRPARRCAASRWTRRPRSPSGSGCRRPEAVDEAVPLPETQLITGKNGQMTVMIEDYYAPYACCFFCIVFVRVLRSSSTIPLSSSFRLRVGSAYSRYTRHSQKPSQDAR